MIAAGLNGHGAEHRGRSAFWGAQLDRAMQKLLALGGAQVERHVSIFPTGPFHSITAGHGRPLLLLHGASGGGANWYRLIGGLARSRRVLAPDLPGFGFSAAIEPEAPVGGQIAELLADWLRSIGIEEADVVGTSFGGLVALRLTQCFAVRRLVLIDAVGLAPTLPGKLRVLALPFVARLAAQPSRLGTRLLLRHVLTAGGLDEVHENALVDYLHASARHGDVHMVARGFRQFAAGIQQEAVTQAELNALRDRTLILWGERDTFLPVAEFERACALAGCAPVRIIPGAGHSPNWEAPQLVLHEIENFL